MYNRTKIVLLVTLTIFTALMYAQEDSRGPSRAPLGDFDTVPQLKSLTFGSSSHVDNVDLSCEGQTGCVVKIPVKNSATRGYILVRGVEHHDGTRRDVTVPFVISAGEMKLQVREYIPRDYPYPIEIYITHVTLGGQEVPVKVAKE